MTERTSKSCDTKVVAPQVIVVLMHTVRYFAPNVTKDLGIHVVNHAKSNLVGQRLSLRRHCLDILKIFTPLSRLALVQSCTRAEREQHSQSRL
jgi:hypothetical protein